MVDYPVSEVVNAYFKGLCSAYTADAAHLSAIRLLVPGRAQEHVILPERIAKRPLGPVVRATDETWLILVRWVLLSLITAEEYGVTQGNVKERMRAPVRSTRDRSEHDYRSRTGLGRARC